jgi:WD40 repeat protein
MTSHPNNSKECLIAGSTNGYIRMWNTRRSTRPSWEANVSTGIGVETENAVTGLYIDERDGVNGTLLFVLSKAGYIFVYDLKKFQVMTFQSVPTPVCIKRYQIMPSVLTSNRSHDGYAYLGLFVCPNKRGILYCNSTSGHTIELDLHNEKASWYHPDIIDFIAVNRVSMQTDSPLVSPLDEDIL